MDADHNLSAFPRRRRFGVRRHDAAIGIPKSESGGMPPHSKAAGEEWSEILSLFLPPPHRTDHAQLGKRKADVRDALAVAR
jgi:hypothetical protein